MTKILEKDIQNAVCEYLSYKRHFFWRQNNTPISEIRNGQRVFRAMPKYAMKGIPDIQVITDGGFSVFLEIKQPKGKLSEHQIAFRDKCKEMGAEYHVITDVSQLKEIGL